MECANNLERLILTCDYLGFPLKIHKIEGSSPVLPFLGIVLDMLKGEIRLPEEKLTELIKLIKHWLQLHNCKKMQIAIINWETFSCLQMDSKWQDIFTAHD